MSLPNGAPFRLGVWHVDPARDQLSRDGEIVRPDARIFRLLQALARRPGEVVSIDELLNEVWTGLVVTPDSVYQAVASLRRLLGDDARQPTYIATVPKLGYRLVAPVGPWDDSSPATSAPAPGPINQKPAGAVRAGGGGRLGSGVLVVIVLCLAFASLALLGRDVRGGLAGRDAGASRRSVAVLPFLDLTTEEMDKEYFADGMTEELIDKLSKIPGFQVPPPTASYFFKGKSMTVPDIARSLRVDYLLDGSVRKSDAMLRISARLVRADDDVVLWSESYDRPLGDELAVQNDIAVEVAKAIRVSLE